MTCWKLTEIQVRGEELGRNASEVRAGGERTDGDQRKGPKRGVTPGAGKGLGEAARKKEEKKIKREKAGHCPAMMEIWGNLFKRVETGAKTTLTEPGSNKYPHIL